MKTQSLTFLFFIAAFLFSCNNEDQKKFASDDPFSITGQEGLTTCSLQNSSLSLAQMESISDQILETYVSREDEEFLPLNFSVDYTALSSNATARQDLCSFVSSLKSVNFNLLDSKSRAAFFINAYNMSSILFIIENQATLIGDIFEEAGVPSILNIRNLGDSFYDKLFIFFQDKKRSLDDIELEVVSDIGAIGHILLHRGAKGFPGYMTETYRSDNIDRLIQEAGTHFSNRADYSDYFEEDGNFLITTHPVVAEVFKDSFILGFGSIQEFLATYIDDSNDAGFTATDVRERNPTRNGQIGPFVFSVGAGSFIDWALNQPSTN